MIRCDTRRDYLLLVFRLCAVMIQVEKKKREKKRERGKSYEIMPDAGLSRERATLKLPLLGISKKRWIQFNRRRYLGLRAEGINQFKLVLDGIAC